MIVLVIELIRCCVFVLSGVLEVMLMVVDVVLLVVNVSSSVRV